MEIPDEMIEFAVPSNKDEQLRINAMIIISDATPIISLLKTNQLELLQKLLKTWISYQ